MQVLEKLVLYCFLIIPCLYCIQPIEFGIDIFFRVSDWLEDVIL
jgi:hypothetical protein